MTALWGGIEEDGDVGQGKVLQATLTPVLVLLISYIIIITMEYDIGMHSSG